MVLNYFDSTSKQTWIKTHAECTKFLIKYNIGSKRVGFLIGMRSSGKFKKNLKISKYVMFQIKLSKISMVANTVHYINTIYVSYHHKEVVFVLWHRWSWVWFELTIFIVDRSSIFNNRWSMTIMVWRWQKMTQNE